MHFAVTNVIDDMCPNHERNKDAYNYVINHKNKNAAIGEKCADDILLWYTLQQKGDLTTFLSLYDREGPTELQQIVFAYYSKRLPWIMIEVDLSDTKRAPSVIVRDFMKYPREKILREREIDKKEVVVWFSKYFGLYKKEQTQGKLIRDDFRCDNLIDFLENKVDEESSTRGRIDFVCSEKMIDEFNECGTCVLHRSFIHILDQIDTQHTFKKDFEEDDLYFFRSKMLLFILRMHCFYFADIEDEIKDHLFMNATNDMHKYEVLRFQKIHQMFQEGTLIYSKGREDKKEDKNDKEDTDMEKSVFARNANIIHDRYIHDICEFEVYVLENMSKEGLKKFKKPKKLRKDDNEGYLPNIIIVKDQTRGFNDISGSRVYYYCPELEHGHELVSIQYWLPFELKAHILDLYCSRYTCPFEKEIDKEEKRVAIEEYMAQFPTYVIMDVVEDEAFDEMKFEVIAAATLEQEAFLYPQHDQYCIFHLLALRLGYENQFHLETLIYRILEKKKLVGNKVLFVKQFGQYDYVSNEADFRKNGSEDIYVKTPWDIFRECNFHLRNDKYIRVLVPPHSKTYAGSASSLANYCGKHLQEDSNLYLRLYKIDNSVKSYARFKDGKYWLFNYNFGWNIVTAENMKYISLAMRDRLKMNGGESILLEGGGARNDGITGRIDPRLVGKKIDVMFTQDYHKVDGSNCAWLTAAVLMNIDDPLNAKKMIDDLKGNEEFYVYMQFKKFSKFQKAQQDQPRQLETLVKYLEKKYQHNLKTVRKTKYKDYKTMMLESDEKGYFLCQLISEGNSKSHVIGIDKTNNLIYDCEENNTFHLCEESLNYCVGRDYNCVKDISECVQLIQSPRKRASNDSVKSVNKKIKSS